MKVPALLQINVAPSVSSYGTYGKVSKLDSKLL
jgi:hypothetical protein